MWEKLAWLEYVVAKMREGWEGGKLAMKCGEGKGERNEKGI